MPRWERLFFWLAYLRGRTPWDTNVTPPELVDTIEGPDALSPGCALDLGCGTGTNVIYLAQNGWKAVGVDFVTTAIRQAKKKAQAAGMAAHFFVGDVTRLDRIQGLTGPFDLVLDIGCFHSIPSESRSRYAAGLADQLHPGGCFLLYSWGRGAGHDAKGGVSQTEIEAIFAPHLRITRIQRGEEQGWVSAWYWLHNSRDE
jgi:SAM-dependent methyltransferase